MPAKNSYREHLKQDLGALIDKLELSDLQKRFLHSRWLDQVVWMEGAADGNRMGYYALRLTAIVGAVIVPALVSLNLPILRYIIIILSLLVAISTAVEQFLHFGERWRHYRRTVELLKSEGWQFFQKSGRYKDYKSHTQAYSTFAAQVETISQLEVEVYITKVVPEKEEKKEGNTGDDVKTS
jgi:hypothetical protein